MRVTNQNASTKVTAASVTITFTSADFDANGMVKAGFLFTGAGMTVGDITRIRVKNGGVTSHDFTLAEFQAWYQKYYGVAPVAADTAFDLPFHLPMLEHAVEEADKCQMIRGSNPAIELVLGAGAAAGTCQMSWTKNITAVPVLYPVLLDSAMQIGASSNSAHYPLNEPGFVKGVALPTAGLTRARVVLAGVDRVNVEGVTLWAQMQRERNAQVVTDPIFFDLGGEQTAPQGTSYIELDTAAGFVGAAGTECLYALRQQ